MVVKTNRYGEQLVKNNYGWAIIKPSDKMNIVYHVGSEKYIRKVWNDRFTIVYDICPITGMRMTTGTKQKRENNGGIRNNKAENENMDTKLYYDNWNRYNNGQMSQEDWIKFCEEFFWTIPQLKEIFTRLKYR